MTSNLVRPSLNTEFLAEAQYSTQILILSLRLFLKYSWEIKDVSPLEDQKIFDEMLLHHRNKAKTEQ